MNLNANPTVDQLRDLLRRCDDTAGHHVLWVKGNGDVVLSRIPKNGAVKGFEQDHPEMKMRYETFLAGNEYVGPEAAQDDEWVYELLENLLKEWPKARGKAEVACLDGF
jgi:hypothetical protein